MKRLHKAIISFGFAVMLVAGSGSALANSPMQKERVLSGVILDVDSASRTVTVRELGTNLTTRIQIPARRRVRLARQATPFADFEQLRTGMVIRDVLVY